MSKSVVIRTAILLGWIVIGAVLSLTLFVKTFRIDLEIILRAAGHLAAREPMYNISDSLEHTKIPLVTFYFIPLAKLGLAATSRIFDLLNLVAYPFLLLFLARKLGLAERNRPTLLFLTLLLTLNPWNTELWTGQNNVLLALAVLAAGLSVPLPLAGFLMFFALMMKPTYFIFLSWVLRHAPRPGRLFLWSGVAGLLTAAAYVTAFGWEALVGDHLSWIAFLPRSSQKHLAEIVNYGFPASLHRLPHAGELCLVLGLLFSEGLCRKVREPFLAFALLCPVVVICSPMAWFQNYTLAGGLVLLIVAEFLHCEAGARKTILGAALFALFLAFPLRNPEVLRHSKFGEFAYLTWRITLWATVAAFSLWGAARSRLFLEASVDVPRML